MGGEIYGKDPEQLTPEEYRIAKATVHGSNYGMGIKKFAAEIGRTVGEARDIRAKYLLLIPELRAYHKRIQKLVDVDRRIRTCFGRIRIFTGRTEDHETHKSGYAQQPQSIVVDVMNLGIMGLWLVMPREVKFLTQTHDSVLISLKPEKVEWIKDFLRGHLEREILIEGEKLTIPLDIGEPKENWLGK